MRKLTLFFAFLLSVMGVTQTWAQETLTVHNGTATNEYVPVYGYYADTGQMQVEFILPANELEDMKDGTISKLQFYTSEASTKPWGSTFQVYLQEVEQTEYALSGTFIGTDNSTIVYTGNLDAQGSTMDIDFTNNYEYKGGNLMIGIKVISSSSGYAHTFFYGESTSNYPAKQAGGGGGRHQFLPKTTFTYNPPAGGATDPRMTLPETSWDFGKVNADVTHAFTVSNEKGKGELTATIGSDNADFSVIIDGTTISAGETGNLIVAAGQAGTFTVKYNYVATDYGMHNGTITVTPNVGNAKTIRVSAKVVNPYMWSEDFTSDPLENGWTIEGDNSKGFWTFDYANGLANSLWYDSNYNHAVVYLSTPKLEVEDNDELKFQYKRDGAQVRMQYKQIGGSWTNLATIGTHDETDSDYQTYTIHASDLPSVGTYQFRFQNDKYSLKSFEGFKEAAAKEHDAEIESTTIKATGSQYVEYTSSVTVKVTGTNNENLIAKFFIGEVQYGEDVEKTVNAGTSETFTISFTPEEVLSGNAYFMVTNDLTGNDKIDLVSSTQSVTIAAAVILDETTANTIATGIKPAVNLKYTAVDGWNTICVPFTLTTNMLTTIFGEGYRIFQFFNYADNVITFSNVSYLGGGTPYLVYVENAVSHPDGVVLTNVNFLYNAPRNVSKYYDGNYVYFNGTFAPVAAGSKTETWYGVTSDGEIRKAGSGASLDGFRAYFTGIPETANARINIDDFEATGIGSMKIETKNNAIYNLNGQKVNDTKKGIYVINGKKVVVK